MLYGAAQFSKDIDLLLLADDVNYDGMHRALEELGAVRIAVPRFDPAVLECAHAVHYRCKVPEAEGLRVDIMTSPRDLPALDAEMRVEQEKDRIYWEPLKREMEAFRRAEREQAGG